MISSPIEDDEEGLSNPISEFSKGLWSSLTTGNMTMIGGAAEAAEVLAGRDPDSSIGRKLQNWITDPSRVATPPTDWDTAMGKEGFQFSDIIGALNWGSGLTGQAVGSMAGPIAAGAGGAVAGGAVGGPPGALIGGFGGAMSVGTALNFGETYIQLRDEGVPVKEAAGWAVPVGLVVGAVDTFGLGKILGAPVMKDIKKKAIRQVVDQFKRGYARGATVEGITEMAQAAIREATAAVLTDNPNLQERALSTLHEGFAGALGGGFIGGVGRATGITGIQRPSPAKQPDQTNKTEEEVQVPEELIKEDGLDELVKEGYKIAAESMNPKPVVEPDENLELQDTDKFVQDVSNLAGKDLENLESFMEEFTEGGTRFPTLSSIPSDKRQDFLESLKSRIEESQKVKDGDLVFDTQMESMREAFEEVPNYEEIDSGVRELMGLEADTPIGPDRRKAYMEIFRTRLKSASKNIASDESSPNRIETESDTEPRKLESGNIVLYHATLNQDFEPAEIKENKPFGRRFPKAIYTASTILDTGGAKRIFKIIAKRADRGTIPNEYLIKREDIVGITEHPKQNEEGEVDPNEWDAWESFGTAGQAAQAGQAAPTEQGPAGPSSHVPVAGQKDVVVLPNGERFDVQYEIVDAAKDVILSNTVEGPEIGGPNPAYDPVLQNRNLQDQEETIKIKRISKELDEFRLGRSNSPDFGAPILGSDNMMEHGNGRMIAAKLAYVNGTAEGYRQFVNRVGDTTGMEMPVLVRRRIGEVDSETRRRMTRQGNKPTSARLGTADRAMSDAEEMKGGLFKQYRGGKLTSVQNAEFVRQFIDKVIDPNESQEFVTPEGLIDAAGLARMESAIMAAAFDSRGMVQELMSDAEPTRKSIRNVLTEVAPAWAQMRDKVQETDPSQDITQAIEDSVMLIGRSVNKGQSIKDLFSQGNLIKDADPLTEGNRGALNKAVLKWFYSEDPFTAKKKPKLASQAKMIENLEGWITRVKGYNPNQKTLTGPPIPPSIELMGEAATAGEYAFASGERPTLPSILEIERENMPEELVRKSDIVKDLSSKLGDIPIRMGRISQKAEGIYKVKGRAIRLKKALDIPVLSHEVGHDINNILYGTTEGGQLNYEPLKPFRKELTAIATDPLAGQSSLPEGFAEFVRMYLTRPAEAKKKAPKFHKEFESRLEENPELKDVIHTTREDIRRWVEQPAAAKVLSQISSNPDAPKTNKLQNFYTKMLDRYNPIKVAVESMAKKSGQTIPETEAHAYELARLFAGSVGKADHFMQKGTFKADTLEVHGKALQEIVKPIEDQGKLNDLRVYLVAKRVVEKHGQGIETGIEIAEAKKSIEEVRSPEIEKAAKEIWEYSENLLQYMVEAEFMSQEQADLMKKFNRYYVPFYRVMEDRVGKAISGGKKFADLWSPTHKMKGDTREIIDPLESIIKNTYSFIELAESNRIGLVLARQAEKSEGSAQWVEKVPAKLHPVSFNLAEIKKTIKDAGVDISQASKKDMEAVATIFRPELKGSPGENIISVFNRGKRELYQVDSELYKSMMGMNEESSNLLIQILSKPAKLLRLGATGISPEFLSRNPLRDAAVAFILSKNGFKPGVDTAKGMFHALKKDDLYWEWVRAGGDMAALVSMDRTNLQSSLQDMLDSPMQMVVRHPIEAMRILSAMSEQATRLGEFGRAKGKGKSLRKSAFESRQVPQDFAIRGSATQAVNQIVAFWNATLIGTERFVSAHMENPKGTVARAVAGVTVPTLILYAINHDDEDYQELPKWQKDFFWMIPVKGTPLGEFTPFIPIPKPFLWGLVYGSSVERALDFIVKKDPKALDGFLNSITQTTLPGYSPTATQPIIEWWANKSMFKGRDLVPGYLENLPEEYQFEDWTSEFSKKTAMLFKKADIPVSPIKLDNAIFGYTAGAGRMVLQATDAMLKDNGGPPLPSSTMADVPGLRAFAVRFPSGATQSVQDLYERLDELDSKAAAVKVARKNTEIDVAPMTGPERGEHRRLRAASRRLQLISKQVRRIQLSEKMSSEEKREKLDELARRKIKIARIAVKGASQ